MISPTPTPIDLTIPDLVHYRRALRLFGRRPGFIRTVGVAVLAPRQGRCWWRTHGTADTAPSEMEPSA